MKEGTIIRELSEDKAEREIEGGTIGGGNDTEGTFLHFGFEGRNPRYRHRTVQRKGDLSRLLGGEAEHASSCRKKQWNMTTKKLS